MSPTLSGGPVHWSPVIDALDDLRRGRPILLVDADGGSHLVASGDLVDATTMSFLVAHGSGIVLAAIDDATVGRLRLRPMVAFDSDPTKPAFLESIDVIAGTTTGISASDRALTFSALVDPSSTPSSFARPGHVFPVRTAANGVLDRQGAPEAALDAVRSAGGAVAAITQLVSPADGAPPDRLQLHAFAEEHALPVISVEQVLSFRGRTEALLTRVDRGTLETPWGAFDASDLVFDGDGSGFMVFHRGLGSELPVTVAIHESCVAADLLQDRSCSCGLRLRSALYDLASAKAALLIYVPATSSRGVCVNASRIDDRAALLLQTLLAFSVTSVRLLDDRASADDLRVHGIAVTANGSCPGT